MLKILPPELSALAEYNQFILWYPSPRPDGKIDKFPVNYLTGRRCDAHDPTAWMDYKTAEAMAAMYGDQYYIGYTFTDNDPFFFVDIDECLAPCGTKWNDNALFILSQLPGAAVEVSTSMRGLHVIGRGVPGAHGCKNGQLNTDLYTTRRFCALTGTNIVGSAGLDCTAPINRLAREYFPPTIADLSDWTTEPVPEYNGIDDDTILIKKACAARSAAAAFGDKCSFNDLWVANEEALSRAFPDGEGYRAYDYSQADAALSQHLAFWTGKNCDRIHTLMWQSALVRDKWQREDYLIRTITKSISIQKDVYTAGPLREIAAPVSTQRHEPQIVSGYQYLGATTQLEHFRGCVYIQDIHRVFTPSGAILKPDQFNATYGGYVFQLDETGDKTTRKAWEAFTESQIIRWPQAESKCFRPELQTGSLIYEEGRTLVNTYVAIETPRQRGDPTPFLNHLAAVLPLPRDREIFLSYMAACIQHKGIKFRWAPLLQGVEGNGKTLFTRCVAFAMGSRYVHMPLANEISEKFNDWAFEKLLIGVEDVFVPANKQEVIEVLKPLITNDFHAMRAMQQSQVMRDNRANFMLNSNHKDAIRKTRNDRRFAVFYTAQQREVDLTRDGMTGGYFPQLYAWLRGGGYAIVSDYLAGYAIPEEFNPAGSCHRAPVTSSTEAAIVAGLGSVEQEILEAVEEERTGFKGGWISSIAVERLLSLMRMSRTIPQNKRRDLLQSLGYDWHPALKNGRANNAILIDDGKKPILFIKTGHIHANLSSPAEIARIYQESQGAQVQVAGGPAAIFNK